MAYSKLHSSIVNSSLWVESDSTRLLFITLLALADRDGMVYGSRYGLGRIAHIAAGEIDEAWESLLSPDPDSSDKIRSPQNEGRRVEEVSGGFRLLNHEYYRGLRNDDDRREQNRVAQAKFKAKVSQGKPESAEESHDNPQKAHTEAEADAESEDKICLRHLNQATGKGYRLVESNLKLIRSRLLEPEVTAEGIITMIDRQVRLWTGTAMEQYLRPSTLFGPSKFSEYYDTRDQPIPVAKAASKEPDWVQEKRLESSIAEHPANREFIGYDAENVTERQKQELRDLKAQLAKLRGVK